MALDNESKLDHVGWRLLRLLQEDGRQSYAELARKVGMSLPAVAERVRRMEEAGIIRGYRAEVDTAKLGMELTVFIELKTPPDKYKRFLALAEEMPEIRECHHVTGSGAFIIRAIIGSVRKLEPVLEQLSQFGQTTTSIVMSTPVDKKVVSAPSESG